MIWRVSGHCIAAPIYSSLALLTALASLGSEGVLSSSRTPGSPREVFRVPRRLLWIRYSLIKLAHSRCGREVVLNQHNVASWAARATNGFQDMVISGRLFSAVRSSRAVDNGVPFVVLYQLLLRKAVEALVGKQRLLSNSPNSPSTLKIADSR